MAAFYRAIESDSSLRKDFERVDVAAGGKILTLLNILAVSESVGDKVVVYSTCMRTLDYIEKILAEDWSAFVQGPNLLPGKKWGGWKKNKDFFRLDGSTSSRDRHSDTVKFNEVKKAVAEDDDDVVEVSAEIAAAAESPTSKVFLISTRAGGIGINLVGANRVVILDPSWNPTHDIQAICRVYRFGQKKKTFIYSLIAESSMEEKIYARCVQKIGLAQRVVDNANPERMFDAEELGNLFGVDNWIQCDEPECGKWRMLPHWVSSESFDELSKGNWTCKINTYDPLCMACSDPELNKEEYSERFRGARNDEEYRQKIQSASANSGVRMTCVNPESETDPVLKFLLSDSNMCSKQISRFYREENMFGEDSAPDVEIEEEEGDVEVINIMEDAAAHEEGAGSLVDDSASFHEPPPPPAPPSPDGMSELLLDKCLFCALWEINPKQKFGVQLRPARSSKDALASRGAQVDKVEKGTKAHEQHIEENDFIIFSFGKVLTMEPYKEITRIFKSFLDSATKLPNVMVIFREDVESQITIDTFRALDAETVNFVLSSVIRNWTYQELVPANSELKAWEARKAGERVGGEKSA
jgi:hypothetical protein